MGLPRIIGKMLCSVKGHTINNPVIEVWESSTIAKCRRCGNTLLAKFR